MRSRQRQSGRPQKEAAVFRKEESPAKRRFSRKFQAFILVSLITVGLLVIDGPFSSWKDAVVNPENTWQSVKFVQKTTTTSLNNSCNGFAGIYHIQSGDVGGAAATIFFQFVIAQLIYAEDYNLKPWVFFNNISHHVYDQNFHNATGSQPTIQFTMMNGTLVEHRQDVRLRRAAYPGTPYAPSLKPHNFQFTGDGVWEHYFEPVSDFIPGDTSCTNKPLVTMDIWSITPGLHIYAPWTPRMWRYDVLPDYMQQRHKTLRQWLTPQRLKANQMTQKYIRAQPHLWEMASKLLPNDKHCVGMHVRWSDKGGGRRLIGVDEFLPYVERFLEKGGDCVFVATDSGRVLEHIHRNWPEPVRSVLTCQGDNVIRSNDETPVFEKMITQQLVSHHRTNTEVLVDILALSKCAFLLHGHSAVSDSAMYLTKDLIYQSVNLEDPDDFSLDVFGELVADVLLRNVGVNHTRYFPQPWWMAGTRSVQAKTLPTNPTLGGQGVCDEYRGILHIKIGGGEDFSFGMTFFHFILNQLLYADMYNLKPWIHLSSDGSQAVYDKAIHGAQEDHSFDMLAGVAIESISSRLVQSDTDNAGTYPADFESPTSQLPKTSIQIAGNGVWDSYFHPVSNFDPHSPASLQSCQDKPLVTLNKDMVHSGLHKWAPWSIRAFKYSGVADDLWWRKETAANPFQDSRSISNFYLPMRQRANAIIRKYYKPHEYIWKRVQEVNPMATVSNQKTSTGSCCLSVHVRQGDKENYGRRKPSRLGDYKPYMEAFLSATNKTSGIRQGDNTPLPYIYLATDSWKVWDVMEENWPTNLRSRILSQGKHVVRSVRWVPAYLLEPEDHHRVNLEALVDILALSKCQFLLHGSSTISEAAIYVNLDLHNNSFNLDDPNHPSVEEFTSHVLRSGFCT